MSDIELKLGQTAQPGTCGSCKFFSRAGADIYGVQMGLCNIKLPPQIEIKSGNNTDGDYVGPTNRINDSDRCDFHRPTGEIYIEKLRVRT